MSQRACALVAAIHLAIAVSPANAKAETNLVIRSEGDCPSGEMVNASLRAIHPDADWPNLTATIRVVEDQLQVMLGEDQSYRREVPLPPNCSDRADRAALVIAVWSDELSTHVRDVTTLSIAMPAPTPLPVPAQPKQSATVTEMGLSGFYSPIGGWGPGGQLELGRLRREGGWGIRARASYQSTKSLRVDIGESSYDRALLGAAIVLQWQRPRFFLSGDGGLVGSFTRARGEGYSENQSASGLNAGLAADGRVGLRLGVFRIWADLWLCRWARKETIQVDSLVAGPSNSSAMPAWAAHLGMGASVLFD